MTPGGPAGPVAGARVFDVPDIGPAVVIITGIMGAGKSTIAQALCERLPRSAHVHGDAFRRMVVGGRVDMTSTPSDEARRQLDLRYRLAVATADGYAAAGFTAVLQDVVIGADLTDMVDRVATRPRFLVVLAPGVACVREREAGRPKTGYGGVTVDGLDAALRDTTPCIGLWIDSSALSVAGTIDAILGRFAEASLDPAPV